MAHLTKPPLADGGADEAGTPLRPATQAGLWWRARALIFRKGTLELTAFLIGLFAPFVLSDIYSLRVLTLSWLYSALSIGLVVSLGYTGIFNMAQGSFYGLGAYATAILVTHFNWPFELAIVMAITFTAAVGMLVSLTTLRIRGDYWALVSLAFTAAVEKVLSAWRPVTDGLDGYLGIPILSFFHIVINSPITFYYSSLAVMAIAFIATRNLVHSFAGRAMVATRVDEAAAQAMGVSTRYHKILSLGWSSAVAGLAGAFLVAIAGYIYPTDFGILPSFNVTLFVVVGGTTSLWGAVIATTFLNSVTQIFRPLTDYQFGILGVAVVLAIFIRGGVLTPPSLVVWRQTRRLLSRLPRAGALR
jgi:branched-chain amino acid transport system permease protein